MNWNARRGMLLIGVTLALFAVSCGWHRWRNAPIEKKAEWISEKISDKLDLDDSQEAKLFEIRDEIVAKFKEKKAIHLEVHKTVIEEVKSDKIDKEKLNKAFASREADRTEMREFLIDKFAEFHAVLTPEQRKKAAYYLEKFHNRMNDHW